MSTLSDDIAEVEQRARKNVHQAHRAMNETLPAALDRYGAVCWLAGRWEEHRREKKLDCAADCAIQRSVRMELARLMEGL